MMIVKRGIVLFSVGFLLLMSGCSSQRNHRSTQVLMGTFVEVISSDQRAAGIVFAEIKRLDGLLSKFNPRSEIFQLNQGGKLKVGPDTLAVIKAAKEFSRQSNGAFDITVAPLVDIWKQAIKSRILPKENRINTAKSLVGSENILIDEKNSTVTLLKKGMQVDLGGIAKGYAVDCAIRKLKGAGIKSCLVNAGGNMYGLGKNEGRPWKVGIRHPRKPREMVGFLLLENRAIATSGDYEQYFETGNRRFSHIIDPQTGYPVNNGVVSVTVYSPSAATCDALSTAVFVLGKEKGARLAQRYQNTQAIILTKEDLHV
jgi:FAD:protein FMN transferase